MGYGRREGGSNPPGSRSLLHFPSQLASASWRAFGAQFWVLVFVLKGRPSLSRCQADISFRGKGLPTVAKTIFAKDGARGFYRGMLPILLSTGAQKSVCCRANRDSNGLIVCVSCATFSRLGHCSDFACLSESAGQAWRWHTATNNGRRGCVPGALRGLLWLPPLV